MTGQSISHWGLFPIAEYHPVIVASAGLITDQMMAEWCKPGHVVWIDSGGADDIQFLPPPPWEFEFP